MTEKKVIGRSDFADFPTLGLEKIAVKIDTGAYTSSIHCHNIFIKENKKGEQILHFNLLDPEHENYHDKALKVKDFTQKLVKNSFGESEERFIIQANIKLFNELHEIELALTDRGSMRFPVLLGRKLLEHFIVDVTQSNLSLKQQINLAE